MPDEATVAVKPPEPVKPMGSAETPVDPPAEFERPPLPAGLLDPTGAMNMPPVLPGMDGLPFRGPIPDLKDTDPDVLRPQIAMKVHVDIFVLNNPKDLKYYKQVIQLIANGYAAMGTEDRVYDPDLKTWRILVRWYEQFAAMKPRGILER